LAERLGIELTPNKHDTESYMLRWEAVLITVSDLHIGILE